MKIEILAGDTVDISALVKSVTWSTDSTQAAAKLDVTFVQDSRNSNIPNIRINVGYTVKAYDNSGNLFFQGNIYNLENSRANNQVKFTAFDNLYVLNKSKTTRKITDARAEDVTRSICRELGVKIGNIASTGILISFIANSKSGYEIIKTGYEEAGKQNGRKYLCIMDADRLCVVERGTSCGVELDSSRNMTDSIYKVSIDELINAVMIVDEHGDAIDYVADESSIRDYSMFQGIYKQTKDRDARLEAKNMINTPDASGTVVALGDFRCKAGYSLNVKDSNFNGTFFIKSATHNFSSSRHDMRVVLEYLQ